MESHLEELVSLRYFYRKQHWNLCQITNKNHC